MSGENGAARARVTGVLLALLLSALATGSARAERRIAVVAGNDLGAPTDPPLRFAQRDAVRIAQVLTEVGGIARRDVLMVIGGDPAALRAALQRAVSLAADQPATLMFYYSGHADDKALHLGPGRFAWEEVQGFLTNTRAQLRIALLDACQAGTMTTPKGFVVGPAAPERNQQGTVVLSSAGSSEAAQEALSLGGSFFTHFLIAALRGAADVDGDWRVTLNEAYAYATGHTMRATSAWARTVQHPSFRFDIAGQGDVVLTDLRDGAALLQVGPELAGQVVVTEKGSPQIVVETEKRAGRELRLALPTGRLRGARADRTRGPGRRGGAGVGRPGAAR